MSTASRFIEGLRDEALKQLGLEIVNELTGPAHPSLTKWFETGDNSVLLTEPGSSCRMIMTSSIDAGEWTISVYELSLEDHLVLIVENHHDEPGVYSLVETD